MSENCIVLNPFNDLSRETYNSISIKIYDDQNISITKSDILSGKLKSIDSIPVTKIQNNTIDLVTSSTNVNIEIDTSSTDISQSNKILTEIIYMSIPDGPLGISIIGLNSDFKCEGLKITELQKLEHFQIDDVIISINGTSITSMSVSTAVKFLCDSKDRKITLLRKSTNAYDSKNSINISMDSSTSHHNMIKDTCIRALSSCLAQDDSQTKRAIKRIKYGIQSSLSSIIQDEDSSDISLGPLTQAAIRIRIPHTTPHQRYITKFKKRLLVAS
jgi:hypothetical protein